MRNNFARPSLSGTALKRLACVSMLLDHIGASCILLGVFGGDNAAALSGTPLAVLYIFLRCAGRLAFPLYCFLLVEGFLHTHSARRYAARLAVFAVVSEVPFDRAFFGVSFYPGHQNVYWTLGLGLLAMALIRRADGGGPRTWRGVACAVCCAAAAELLHTDYGAIGVLTIAALYYTRAERQTQCLTGALLTLYEPPAPLAFAAVWCYNGQRGKCANWEKWAYYLFYPVHLAVLGAITFGMIL